jgi:hypothetical protein
MAAGIVAENTLLEPLIFLMNGCGKSSGALSEVAQGVAIDLPTPRDRSEQTAIFNLGRGHPGLYSLLHPDRDGHRSNSPTLALQVHQNPTTLPLTRMTV